MSERVLVLPVYCSTGENPGVKGLTCIRVTLPVSKRASPKSTRRISPVGVRLMLLGLISR